MSIRKFLAVFSPHWRADWVLSRRLALAIQFVCAAAIIPLLYICRYVHPSGMDDYLDADWTSFPGGLLHLYMISGGRYFTIGAAMLSPLHWHSITGYRIACFVLLLAFIWSFYSLIRKAIRTYTMAPGYAAGAVAAASVVLMLNNMRKLSENFFWYTGAATYTLPTILLVWFIYGLLFWHGLRMVHRVSLAVLCIAIMGGSELTMLLCIVISCGGWLYASRANLHQQKKVFALLSLICLVCAVVSIIAPGNYVRLGNHHPSLAMVIPDWLYFTQKFAYKWITNPFLLSFSVVLVIITQAYPLRKPFLSLLGAFMLPIGIMYLLGFPVNLALGTIYSPRVMNVTYAFFVLGWIVFVLHLSFYIREALSGAGQFLAWWRQIMLIAGIIILLVSFNTYDLRTCSLYITYKGLARGLPQRYDAELNARYRLLQEGSDTVFVPRIRTKEGNVIYFLDNPPSPADQQNQPFARYWGRKAVGVIKDSTTSMGPY